MRRTKRRYRSTGDRSPAAATINVFGLIMSTIAMCILASQGEIGGFIFVSCFFVANALMLRYQMKLK